MIISTKHLIQIKNELDSIFPNNLQKHSMSFSLVDFSFRKFFGIRSCVHLDGAIRAEDDTLNQSQPKWESKMCQNPAGQRSLLATQQVSITLKVGNSIHVLYNKIAQKRLN